MKKFPKCAGLAQENGFGSAQLHMLLRLVKCTIAHVAAACKRQSSAVHQQEKRV
jgi:hypothetical protein